MGAPVHDAGPFELTQFERQDAMRNRRIVALQIAEPFGAVLEIVEQQRRPSAAQDAHHLLDRALGNDCAHARPSGYIFVRNLHRVGAA
jgi:hypothetical protein